VNGNPLPSFTQGLGYYEITGGTNNGLSEVVAYFGSGGDYTTIDVTGGLYLSVSARLLTGNQANSFSVIIYDSADRQAYATFSTADFNSGGFSTAMGSITSSSGSFNYAEISAFRLSGDINGGAAAFNIAFDNLAVTSSAVPEPSMFACAAGAAALCGALFRRRRRG
jgi:hypothetical protein